MERQVDRDPDTFVKTVLTFGDMPAPAMAQIALRKTADENEDSYPEAAISLKKNSVKTVEQAQELTKGLTKIWKQGDSKLKVGFQAKI